MQQERSRLHYERLRRIRRRSWPSGYKGISVESPHIRFDENEEGKHEKHVFEPLQSTMMNARVAIPHEISRASPEQITSTNQKEIEVFVA